MSRLQSLKNASTLRDVAILLGFTSKGLSYILYRKQPATKYQPFIIQKASGGQRLIQAPADDLKLLQKNLSDLLQDCTAELNATHKWKDDIAHGFKRDKSIVSNASKHRGRRWVFNLDLSDFFGSVNFGRVRGFFIRNRHFALDPTVATILAQIGCHNNSLPQGSPCSPVLSNLIAHVLDIRLVKLAQKTGCTYTRYADDLTFSTNLPNFPIELAVTGAQAHSWVPGNELAKIIAHSGFTINTAKTRMQYRNSRQDVTGLVVNKKVNIRSEYRRMVRSMVYSVFTTGAFHHKKSALTPPGAPQKIPGTTAQLHGMLGHIDSVDLYNKKLLQKSGQPGPSPSTQIHSKENQYRRFLIFEYFYSAKTPVIICEGKTDNIYLSWAIKRLAVQYPSLASVSPANAVALKVRIFKYPETSTGRILQLYGGSGDLKKFIRHYTDEIKKFTAPGLQQPLIIIVDNDTGGHDVGGVMHGIIKKPIFWTEPYIHVYENLYVMPTPLVGGAKESSIEDFFSQQTLNTVLNGKTFKKDPPLDPSLHYGKVHFAEKVIQKDAQTIDFNGFIPVLNNIAAIIADFAAKLAAKAATP
jgi:RNA-directed DNA polymerase